MAEPVFDGHNDVLSVLWGAGDLTGASFFAGRAGDVDLPRARAGGFAGGFFAIWVPGQGPMPDPMATYREFGPVDPVRARDVTFAQAGILAAMAKARPDAIRLCRSVAEIAQAEAAGAIAALLHLEGCEAIGPDLAELEALHALGLRSLGPVWSRPNLFGHGVPFNHPASPDTGPGLTDAGRRLVAACGARRVLVDLSHLNEAGFWDVAAASDAPLVATHSGAHAVTQATRNLTDRQLDAIAERGGLVGLNFGVQFLRPDGIKNPDTGPQDMLRHLDHLLARLGEAGVALGSDFDGAMMPRFIGGAQGLPGLVAALRSAYGDALTRRLCRGNWLALLERVIG